MKKQEKEKEIYNRAIDDVIDKLSRRVEFGHIEGIWEYVKEELEELKMTKKKQDIIKEIWKLAGHSARGTEIRLPYKYEVPIWNRSRVEKLLIELHGSAPDWWTSKPK